MREYSIWIENQTQLKELLEDKNFKNVGNIKYTSGYFYPAKVKIINNEIINWESSYPNDITFEQYKQNKEKQVKVGQTVTVNDNSYAIEVTNREFKETNDLYHKEFTVVQTGLVLPTGKSYGIKQYNDVILRSSNGYLYFTQQRFLVPVIDDDDDMIIINGNEYSEDTIAAALRQYINS